MAVLVLLYPQGSKYFLNELIHEDRKGRTNELVRRPIRSSAKSPGWDAGCLGDYQGGAHSRIRPDKNASAKSAPHPSPQAGSYERGNEEEAEDMSRRQRHLEGRGAAGQAEGLEGRGRVSGQEERFWLGSLD